MNDPATNDLLWALTILAVGIFTGLLLEYCAAAIHRARRPHPHRIADWIAREIHAWHRHHQRTHRRHDHL